ncbi:hypothetical protein H0H81_009732 [Sphagnurus paluster]|uniref:Uncharacterized protein n=1 Tax=Sphagnurus paluster TaxID=117069 RepID=A0A9P7GKV3_9AGAR|nr:hypothetical protein H0H81_009732 [Sphagnurus paluster]
MTEIRFDSDAMVHQMAAKPITSESASQFVSVLDIHHRPLVLCVGNNERFYALQENDTGTFISVDLSAKLGISDKVQAFAVSQNQTSSKLYIAFATGATTSSQSTIHILDAIPPTFVDVKDEELRRSLLSNSTPPSNVRIADFHIVRRYPSERSD